MNWLVEPICEAQRRDVRPEDLVCGGRYRVCDTYRGGGGYDQFPVIAEKRLGIPRETLRWQFVVQLYGCPLDCPYCYVTKAGIFGEPVFVSTEEVVVDFLASGLNTFHLMGGAPALYLGDWPIIQERLPRGAVFHSDMLLVEKRYSPSALQLIAQSPNHLIAVDVKGVTPADFKKNTRCDWDEVLFWKNFDTVVGSGVKFYVTFTNPDPDGLQPFKDKVTRRYGPVLEDSFVIDLVKYRALKP